ncbi:MAG: hypothetical protein ACLFWB_10300, partial [Armatimonadota bacterium]
RALLDSPLRQKIADELIEGTTAVWILLESGDEKKDEHAAAVLERELNRLEETIVLTVPESSAPGADTPELGPVKFTAHRLSRHSVSERMFVNMLIHSEEDLATDFSDEPLVFLIYGRGLILYALAGSGINEWTIQQAAEFVSGPCSCEVKAGNPGTDMLAAVDWQGRVTPTQETTPPPSGIASFQDKAAEAQRRFAEVEEKYSGERADEATDFAATHPNGEQAPSGPGDTRAQAGGGVQPAVLLAVIAGAITIALVAVTVIRRRRKDRKEKDV